MKSKSCLPGAADAEAPAYTRRLLPTIQNFAFNRDEKRGRNLNLNIVKAKSTYLVGVAWRIQVLVGRSEKQIK